MPWGSTLEGLQQNQPGGVLRTLAEGKQNYVVVTEVASHRAVVTYEFLPKYGLDALQVVFPTEGSYIDLELFFEYEPDLRGRLQSFADVGLVLEDLLGLPLALGTGRYDVHPNGMENPNAADYDHLYFHSATVKVQEIIWKEATLQTDPERGTILFMECRRIQEERRRSL
ncbi:MAG: hypothetical protein ACYDHY_06410 [Acidiferrobacterales bacterium]